MKLFGKHEIKYHPNEKDDKTVWDLDFKPPFKRINLIKELEKECGVKFPPPNTFHTQEANDFFDKVILFLF
jgi:lysyl-tRNA synthetase class 2